MSFVFSSRSSSNLSSCHPELQRLFNAVLAKGDMDITISCGYRGMYDQNAAFEAGHSKLRFPMSKHNQVPSLAVDVLPFPTLWSDAEAFFHLANLVKAVAKELDISVMWGGDWKTFRDLPHWELNTIR